MSLLNESFRKSINTHKFECFYEFYNLALLFSWYNINAAYI